MEELDHGIYQAIVTSNSSFFNTGKIKVRIQKFYNVSLDWDMSISYDESTFSKNLIEDMEALVHTPIGGGNNYGLFALPQVNSVGLVQFLGGNTKIPVWMGSFFRPEYDEKKKLIRCNVPSDEFIIEGAGSDGISKGRDDEYAQKKIKGGDGTVILRTKTTKGPGREKKKENMDFNKNRTENLIVLSEDEVRIMHFSGWKEKDNKDSAELEQFEEIVIGNKKDVDINGNVVREYPQIEVKITDKNTNNKEKLTTGIKITPEESTLETISQKTKIQTNITSTKNGITIKSKNLDKDEITTYTMDPEQVTILNKSVTIVVEKNDIILSAPEGKIRLSGQEILLGDGGGYVMVRDAPMLPLRTEDGSV